jgi:hypothetical protein
MRLSQIEIENFKGIGSRQRIDLRPITLLFGPNSAGKSTVLQALHYLREVIERNNPDPDQTIAGGLTDLGGFASLVHNHEQNRSICMKVRLDFREDQGSDGLPLNSGASLRDPQFGSLPVRYLAGENTELREHAIVQEVGIGIEVAWSELDQRPYVAQLAVELDGEDLGELRSSSQEGQAELTKINWEHPLLRELVDPDDDPQEWMEELPSELAHDPEEERGDPFGSLLGNELYELSRLAVFEECL